MNTQSAFITSRVGSRVVECPAELVAELQRERQQESVSDSEWLLIQAERIRDNATNYIPQKESSG